MSKNHTTTEIQSMERGCIVNIRTTEDVEIKPKRKHRFLLGNKTLKLLEPARLRNKLEVCEWVCGELVVKNYGRVLSRMIPKGTILCTAFLSYEVQ